MPYIPRLYSQRVKLKGVELMMTGNLFEMSAQMLKLSRMKKQK